jgi:hypothetical protein
MKLEKPRPAVEEDKIVKKSKEKLVIMKPLKPMTAREVMETAEKEGLRPATLAEIEDFMGSVEPGRIKPKDGDIVVEGHEITGEEKELPPKRD